VAIWFSVGMESSDFLTLRQGLAAGGSRMSAYGAMLKFQAISDFVRPSSPDKFASVRWSVKESWCPAEHSI
jgi:hypothetical protein